MLFLSKYLMKISPLVTEIRNFTVSNVENDIAYFTELPGLTPVENCTLIIVFVKYNNSWFTGILAQDKLNILCIPINLRKIVKNIMLQIF